MEHLIIIFTICLGLSVILSEICYRVRYPRIIGPILTGIILGIGPIGDYIRRAESQISFLSELSIIFLLFLAGLEINISKFKKASKDATLIAFFSAALPFIMGFFSVIILYNVGILSGSDQYLVATIVGACMALTAEGTSLAMLIEMNALNTRIGTIILGAGILDDIFEVFFISAFLIFINETSNLLFLPISIFVFVIVILLIWKLVPWLIRFIQKEDSRISTVSTFIVITFFMASLASLFGFSPLIGAFIGGIIIQLSTGNREEERMNIEELKVLTFSLIVPFFFINIGLHFDFTSILAHPVLTLIVLAVAVTSKIFGALIITPFTSLSLRQTHLVGWAMNARGAMELVILELARMNGLISLNIYSAIVIMTIITTLIFPVIFKTIVGKDATILNKFERVS